MSFRKDLIKLHDKVITQCHFHWVFSNYLEQLLEWGNISLFGSTWNLLDVDTEMLIGKGEEQRAASFDSCMLKISHPPQEGWEICQKHSWAFFFFLLRPFTNGFWVKWQWIFSHSSPRPSPSIQFELNLYI